MLISKKVHKGLGYLSLAILVALTGVLYGLHSSVIYQFSNVSWVALAFVLALVLTPLGSKKLITPSQSELTRAPLKAWLGKIFLLQLSVFLILFGAFELTGQLIPINDAQNPSIFLSTLTHSLIFQGLFPWPLVAVFAVSFSILATLGNKDSFFSSTLVNTQKTNQTLNIILDNLGRNLGYCALAFAAMMGSFSLSILIAGADTLHTIVGFSTGAIAAVLLMCVVTFKRSNSVHLQAIQMERPAFGILLTVLIWGFLLALVATVLNHFDSDNLTTLSTTALNFVLAKGWTLHWNLLFSGLLFCFIPLLSIYIARFSYGYSLRALVLGSLALPALAAGLLGLNIHFQWVTELSLTPRLAQGCSLLGFILLVLLTCRKESIAMTNLLFLAKPGPIKPRNILNFIERWRKLSGVLFYLFIPAGVYVLSLFTALAAITFMLVALLAFYRFWKLLCSVQSL